MTTRHGTQSKAPLEEKGTWLNDRPSDIKDVPQEMKNWVAAAGDKFDDPFGRDWYKLPAWP